MAQYIQDDRPPVVVDDGTGPGPGGGSLVASTLIRYATYIAITLIVVFFLVWLIQDSGVI